MPLQQVVNDLKETDLAARKVIQDSQDLMQLQALEQQHGRVWVIPVMGKYTGAYIVVDKDLNYLGKIGEKPVS